MAPRSASPPAAGDGPILEVENLTVTAELPDGRRPRIVDSLSFSLEAGGTLGLVGESGSGKTMTGLAIMGLLPPGVRVESGEIRFEGQNLLALSPGRMRRLRGKRLVMVLQDSLTALDPSFTIRDQLAEPLRQHRQLRGRKLNEALVASLDRVHLSAGKERLSQYPHQLSGGMRQRVTSAIALAGEPRLLIADEPTTALDGTTQARYLSMLSELQERTGFALIFVTHDLFLVWHLCQRIAVMYASQIVEEGDVRQVFEDPRHPYTRALLAAIPSVVGKAVTLEPIEGQAPDVTEVIEGCRFAARCKHARGRCVEAEPALADRPNGSVARCWATEDGGWLA
jgi:peptide/nickel transport system ATP-binding protein